MSTPTFSHSSTADEVAAAFAREIRGKNVLITGTSLNGLGFETARSLAKFGAGLVIITGRTRERLGVAEDALRAEIPGANIRALVLDLASLESVRTAAAEVNAYPEHIDILINNAASSISPFRLTPDGFEHQIATDHLGPFLFTGLILPKLLAAPHMPRVIYVASGAHAWCAGVDLRAIEHPREGEREYNGMQAYARAKSANILTARELARRAGGRVLGFSLTPGAVKTNFGENDETRAELLRLGIITADGTPTSGVTFDWKTPPQGAATIIAAGFDPALTATPGGYLADSVVKDQRVAPHCNDLAMAEKLWELSERLVGVTYAF
ncbi:hypothetical protein B0H14DRAFT_2797137 [Mycena olivaceomarginata]|nr:hypothetical protein B0H14DRAFT_2797137 [Mycena olivaceomarginata]